MAPLQVHQRCVSTTRYVGQKLAEFLLVVTARGEEKRRKASDFEVSAVIISVLGLEKLSD